MIGELIIVGSIVSYFTATIIKSLISIAKHEFKVKNFFASGGMPSSHTSTVTTLTALIFLIEGVTIQFAIAFVFLCIVMTDAIGVRRKAGLISIAVNKELKTSLPERIGHTKLEVAVGFFFGVLVSIFWAAFFL